jgi:transcriptional regulator with XRE-family HTH domain
VPGLRRREVAQLAGASVDYYVRLERGRRVNVSESVLDALARALCLSETERAHLLAIARPSRKRPGPLLPQRVRPGLRRVLDWVSDLPAIVLGQRLGVLATNHLAGAFYTDFEALPRPERNMARFTFFDDIARELYVDWPPAARGIVGSLRLYADRHPSDPQLAEPVGDLSIRSFSDRSGDLPARRTSTCLVAASPTSLRPQSFGSAMSSPKWQPRPFSGLMPKALNSRRASR